MCKEDEVFTFYHTVSVLAYSLNCPAVCFHVSSSSSNPILVHGNLRTYVHCNDLCNVYLWVDNTCHNVSLQ